LEQLADDELLAGAKLELAEVDTPASQANPVDLDLGDPPDPDEHAPALDPDDESVHTRRRAAARGREHDICHMPDLGTVSADERQLHES
jgi:hypothetical protein